MNSHEITENVLSLSLHSIYYLAIIISYLCITNHRNPLAIKFPERHCIEEPAQRALNNVLILYHSCAIKKKHPFSPQYSPVRTQELKCSPANVDLECYEGVPILNYLIDHYDNPSAKIYVFCHAHDKSWHYYRNFWVQIRMMLKTDYFWDADYGGIYQNFFALGPPDFKPPVWYEDHYHYVFDNTSIRPINESYNNFRPCCGTWFMKSKMVHTRTKKELIYIRDRYMNLSRLKIKNKELNECGHLAEYVWHLIFTNQTIIPRRDGSIQPDYSARPPNIDVASSYTGITLSSPV